MQPPTAAGRRPLPPLPSRTNVGPRPGLPPRPAVPTRATGPAAHPTPKRSRPDPTGLRVAIGFGGIAAASALATAFLAPATAAAPAAPGTDATTLVAADVGPVRREVRYVQLLPGQTPPPNASVAQAPAPTPRVVVVTTRQSGARR
jgi:hypothetical protein